jgi:hypothetical protein
MTAEKIAAFHESWNAMAFASFRAAQTLTLAMLGECWSPWTAPRNHRAAAARLRRAVNGILAEGMAPIHRRAVRNAKRLVRSSLR